MNGSSGRSLLVVRPRLRGDDKASFPYWACLNEDEIRACMDGDTRAARIRVLSVLAIAKFTKLRRAVDLSLAALALLALAAAGLALQRPRWRAPAWNASAPRSASPPWPSSRSRTTSPPTTSTPPNSPRPCAN
ncbi:Pycsar system effector family protein [Streptomyces durhamensis]|uniref:Pycsar system effector family protein n=1 Tax=Streptomyces durhamensis TaxID=68194 RepID=UPI001FD73AE6|nr:Pycsar system effector family protein [Streptomyces durhamensis]